MMHNKDSAYVLYVDHQGHPSPLSLCYQATASRRLTSSVDRPIPSSATEVDSAFCPQCLSFQDVSTAGNIGYCSHPSCKLCPLCRSVVSVVAEESITLYKCVICNWNSKKCGIDGTLSGENISEEIYAGAVLKLHDQWKILVKEEGRTMDAQFRSTKEFLLQFAKDRAKGRNKCNTRINEWSLQTLEEAQRTSSKSLELSIYEQTEKFQLEKIPLEDGDRIETLIHTSNQGLNSRTMLLYGAGGTLNGTFLPLPIPLRPRKSRRCCAELKENRPGILVKPKLNPLEGDSSLRTGHGQWWKKDSSAIEVLPRIQVCIDASDGTKHAFLLKVSNPTLSTVRVKLGASSYTGERVFPNDPTTTPNLKRVLVDAFNQVYLDAKLNVDFSKSVETSELCELHPSEDSLLELGSSKSRVFPEAVSVWDAESVLLDSKLTNEIPVTLKVVGRNNSAAWFECVALETHLETSVHNALALKLEIEVGNGLWENSLIQRHDKDLLSFDILLVWETM